MTRNENIPNWWSYHTADGTRVFTTTAATRESHKGQLGLEADESHRELYKGKELERMTDQEFEHYLIELEAENLRVEKEARRRGLD